MGMTRLQDHRGGAESVINYKRQNLNDLIPPYPVCPESYQVLPRYNLMRAVSGGVPSAYEETGRIGAALAA